MEEYVSLDRAFQLIDDNAEPLMPESVELMLASGRVLSERMSAWVDLPGFNRSLLDGYALRSQDVQSAGPQSPVRLKVVGKASLIMPFESALAEGQCLKVTSGSVVPEGADAVIGDEQVNVQGEEVEVLAGGRAGQGISEKASEFRKGELVAEAGVVLSPGWISLLIAAGWGEVNVIGLPRVRVIAVGDELKPPGAVVEQGEVFASGGAGVVAWCRSMGAQDVRMNIAADDPYDVQEAVPNHAVADLVITLGGTGWSERDVVIDALSEMGVEFLFRGVSVKPGHYTAFGTLENMPVLCLPGGPASSEIMFQVLGKRLVYILMGMVDKTLPMHTATLSETIPPRGDFDQLVRVKLESAESGVMAVPLSGKGVHREIAESGGIVLAPKGEELKEGARIPVWITR